MNHVTAFRALLLFAAMLPGMSTASAAKPAAEVEENLALTARVKAALIADDVTEARRIHIETYRGIIQLSGFVATNEEKMRAERLAASVPGVLEVRNALEIRQRLADEGASKEIDDAGSAQASRAGLTVDGGRYVRNELQVEPVR